MRLANVAVKVADVHAASPTIDHLTGLEIAACHELNDRAFLEVHAGDTVINVFDRLLYESSDGRPVDPGFAHISCFIEDLGRALADPGWSSCLIWGPEEIAGGFGRRRIAFFEVAPGVRIELIEDLS